MSLPAAGTRQFYLGIAGQQTGPFSDSDILSKIRSGQVPPDSLVWYEGLPEWQPIATVEFFKDAFAQKTEAPPDPNVPVNPPVSSPAVSPPPPASDPVAAAPASPAPTRPRRPTPQPPGSDEDGPSNLTTFATSESVRPVFAKNEFDQEDGIGFLGKGLIGLGLFLLVVGGGVSYLLMYARTDEHSPMLDKKLTPENPREAALSKAQSEMLLQPDTSLQTMHKLIIDNSEDSVGKESLKSMLEYYRQAQRPIEAGKLLMELKKPLEASKFFLSETSISAQGEAEKALFSAYEQSNDPNQKKELLLADINLLVGPLDKKDLAVERIRLFVKDFPGAPHPYGFYLKSTDEKIYDIFNKISFYFVQSLVAFSTSEFPEISLNTRPVVQIMRERNDQYRIVGSYRGKVKLNLDNLDDIFFTYWMANGQWYVVDTNLTEERRHWAAGNRQRLQNKVLSAGELLAYTEGIFKSQFPDAGFHEKVDPGKAATHKRHDDQ